MCIACAYKTPHAYACTLDPLYRPWLAVESKGSAPTPLPALAQFDA